MINGITTLDLAFAELVQPDATETEKKFLCNLMASARLGHLCYRSDVEWRVEGPIIREKNRYYLQRNWVLETTIVDHLKRLIRAFPKKMFDAPSLSPQLHERQAEVIRHAVSHSLTVVSGGPGTGKTFTAAQLIRSLTSALLPEESLLRVKIAAPTGKAADRLVQEISASEKLSVEGMTLHRLLRLQPGRMRLFEDTSIEADLILVDEASMIDASLFAHLVSSIPTGARLVLLGDADQLPPVDGGSIFPDLVDLMAIRLEQCHRIQDDGLYRLYEAARIGDLNALLPILEPIPKDLFSWIESMGSFEKIRLICPLRKGPLGVNAINAELLRRQQAKLSFGEEWRAPILITSNDSQLKLYNGTPGIIMGCYKNGKLPSGTEMVLFADGRTFPLRQLPGYEIAYALSAHKSQGSEFEQILCLLPPGSEEFGREALYTALTRAKKGVRLAGDAQVLEKMLTAGARQENGFRERMISTLEK